MRSATGAVESARASPVHSTGVDLNELRILSYPAPALRVRARGVPAYGAEARAVADRMIELMREAEGIGLAAPQVGLKWRLFVADVPALEDRSPEADPPTATAGTRAFLSPVITSSEGAPEPFEEGCLSLPDIRGDVLRAPIVTVRAMDVNGKEFTLRCAGLLARCVQHEIDHLDGVLILDRFTQMSRLKTKAAVRDLEREAKSKRPASALDAGDDSGNPS